MRIEEYLIQCVGRLYVSCVGKTVPYIFQHAQLDSIIKMFFSILENKLIGYADDSTLMAVVPSPGAESLNRDLVRVNAWCDLWGMKLNASKTKTMIVFRSRTMHPQSPPLTTDGTVLKESDDLDILGVTFDSKLTFEKHLRSVSRAASQRLGILRKSWHVFHD